MKSEQSIRLDVNGKSRPPMPPLYALCDDLGLHGPLIGFGFAQCGACTGDLGGGMLLRIPRHLRGWPAQRDSRGRRPTRKTHRPQYAFIDEQAVQCSYFINGMIMQAVASFDFIATGLGRCAQSRIVRKHLRLLRRASAILKQNGTILNPSRHTHAI